MVMATAITQTMITTDLPPVTQPTPITVHAPPGSQGRPSSYSETVVTEVLDRLAAGETLRAICQSSHLPAEATIRSWDVDNVMGFSARYACARSHGLDSRADRIHEIASDRTRDPNCRRVEVDAEKWVLSKLRPDKYGDLTRMEHSGPGGAAIPSTLTVEFVRPGESASQRIIDVTPTAEVPALPAPVVIDALPGACSTSMGAVESLVGAASESHSQRELALMAEIARLKAEGDKLRRKALRRERKAKQADRPAL